LRAAQRAKRLDGRWSEGTPTAAQGLVPQHIRRRPSLTLVYFSESAFKGKRVVLAVCTGWDGFRDDGFMSEAARTGGLSLRSPRRRRSADERRLIVEETLEAGSSVARVAMKHGVNANQVFKWRRLYESGRLGTRAARDIQLLPVRVAVLTGGCRSNVCT
jgi:hypothetical protein